MRQFTAAIWIHAHHRTRRAYQLDLFRIGGHEIEVDFVRYLLTHNTDPYVLEQFAALRTETCYNVLGRYWFADGEYDLIIDAFVEVAPDAGELDTTDAAVPVELAF